MIDLKILKERISSLQKHYNRLVSDRSSLNQKITDLNVSMSKDETELKRLRDTKKRYNTALRNIETKNPVKRKKAEDSLRNEYNNIDTIDYEINQLEQALQAKKSDKNKTKNALSSIDDAEKTLIEEFNKLSTKYTSLIAEEQNRLSEDFDKYNNALSEINQLSQELAEAQNQIQELQTSRAALYQLRQEILHPDLYPDSDKVDKWITTDDIDKRIVEVDNSLSVFDNKRKTISSLQSAIADISPESISDEWEQLEALKKALKSPRIPKSQKKNRASQFDLGAILNDILTNINIINPNIRTKSEEMRIARDMLENEKKAEASRKADLKTKISAAMHQNKESQIAKKAEQEEAAKITKKYGEIYNSYFSNSEKLNKLNKLNKDTVIPQIRHWSISDECKTRINEIYESNTEETLVNCIQMAFPSSIPDFPENLSFSIHLKDLQAIIEKLDELVANQEKAEEEAARKKAKEEAARKKAEEEATKITKKYGEIYNSYFSNSEKLNKLNKLNKDTVIPQIRHWSISDECKTRINEIYESNTEETLVNCIQMAFPSSIPDFPENLSFSVHLQDLKTIIGKLDELVANQEKAEAEAEETKNIQNEYNELYANYFYNSNIRQKLNNFEADSVIPIILSLPISKKCYENIQSHYQIENNDLLDCILMSFPSDNTHSPIEDLIENLEDLKTIIGKLDELVAEQEKKDLEKEFNAALKEASTKTTYIPEEQILSDYNTIRNSFTSGQYNQLDTATISKLLSELPNFKQYYQKFSNLMNHDEHPDRLVSSAIKFSFPLLTLSDPPLDILTHLRNIRAIQTKLDELVAEQENSEQQGAEEGAFPSSEKLQNQITNLKNQINPINTKPRPIEETKPVDNDYPDFGPFDRVDNGFGIPDGSYPDFTSLFNETPDEEEDPYENELDDDEHDDDEQQKDAFYDIYNDPKFSYLLDEEEDPYENEHDDDEELDDNYFDPEFLNLFGTPPDDEHDNDDDEHDEEEPDDEKLDEEEPDEEEPDEEEPDEEEHDIEDADFEEDKEPRFLHKIGNAIHNGFSSFLRIITMKDTPQLGAGDDEYDEYDDEYDDADKYPTKAAQRKEMTAGIHEDTPVLSHEFFENKNPKASRDSRNSTDPRDPE